jgi:hypothetical protein
MMAAIERRIGAGAMGLTLIEMMFSIFRGHIPDHAVRTASPVAIPPGAVMGVLAAAALAIGLLAAALWATVWLALRLI